MADGWAKKIAASLLLPAMAFISAYLFTSAFSQSIRQKLRLGLHFNGAHAPPGLPASQASPEAISTTSKDPATSASRDFPSTTEGRPGSPSSTTQGAQLADSDGRSFTSSTSSALSTSLRPSAGPAVRGSTTRAAPTTQAVQGSRESAPSVGEGQAQLGVQWRPLAASDRYRFTPQTLPPFRQCEEEHLGMSKWKQKLRGHGLEICGAGVSTITCARHLTKQQVYVCQFRDVVELLSPTGTLSWVAQCNLRREVNRRMLFSQLSPRHPLQNLDVRRQLGAKQLTQPITILESLPGNVSLLDHISASLQWNVQNKSAAREGLTFMSTGDCNTGNPGHCQADQDNLFIVQHILPKTFRREETRVVLYNGFGRSRYSAQKASLPHFYEDWQALSAEIVTASYSADFPSLKVKAEPYVQLVRYLVSGPAGMTGPHWTRFNQPGLCEGRSPLLLAHQMAALPFFESEWGRDPKRYGDACNFMRKLSAEHSLHLLNGKVCKIDARQSNFYLWISRIPPDCHKIPSLGDSCGKNRGVANGLELATELSKRYTDATILYVNTGTIPYLDQVFLIRAASTIIAAHGGGLWNAARWLNEALHQRVVEIMPIGGPSESCSLTKMFGCRYNFVTCYDCITPRNGRLSFEKLLKAVEATEGVHCNGV